MKVSLTNLTTEAFRHIAPHSKSQLTYYFRYARIFSEGKLSVAKQVNVLVPVSGSHKIGYMKGDRNIAFTEKRRRIKNLGSGESFKDT